MTFTPKKLILLTLSSIFFLFAFTEVKETLQASANKKEIAKQEAKSAFKAIYDPAEESRARIGPLGFTGEMKLYDWFYYRTNDDRTVYMGRRYSSFPTVRYLKGEDYMEFFMNKIVLNDQVTDVASTTSTTLETQVLLPNDPVLHYRQIMKETDVAYKITNIPFTVKEEIVLRSKIPNLTEDLSFLFSVETTTIPEKQQDGSIAFFDQEGNYLFQMEKPFMIDDEGNRSEEVSIDIKSTKKERRQPAMVTRFGGSSQPATVTLFGGPGRLTLSINSIFKYLKLPIPTFKNQNRQAMSVLGPQHYIITLTASSKWLNDPNTVYPVIIDPTISHNEDAEFDGQKNRIVDSDSTSSTQLESSYGENANDPYTVLNLHFNEANGTTAGIRDYASTTRVITANGNASTTNYVTQLGMGNSAGFDGTGDYLSVPNSNDTNFGTGDFTIDLWVYDTGTVDSNAWFNSSNRQFTGIVFGYVTGGNYILSLGSTGTSYDIANSANIGPQTLNTWMHYALVRSGNNFYVFRDGVQVYTVNSSASIYC